MAQFSGFSSAPSLAHVLFPSPQVQRVLLAALDLRPLAWHGPPHAPAVLSTVTSPSSPSPSLPNRLLVPFPSHSSLLTSFPAHTKPLHRVPLPTVCVERFLHSPFSPTIHAAAAREFLSSAHTVAARVSVPLPPTSRCKWLLLLASFALQTKTIRPRIPGQRRSSLVPSAYQTCYHQVRISALSFGGSLSLYLKSYPIELQTPVL